MPEPDPPTITGNMQLLSDDLKEELAKLHEDCTIILKTYDPASEGIDLQEHQPSDTGQLVFLFPDTSVDVEMTEFRHAGTTYQSYDIFDLLDNPEQTNWEYSAENEVVVAHHHVVMFGGSPRWMIRLWDNFYHNLENLSEKALDREVDAPEITHEVIGKDILIEDEIQKVEEELEQLERELEELKEEAVRKREEFESKIREVNDKDQKVKNFQNPRNVAEMRAERFEGVENLIPERYQKFEYDGNGIVGVTSPVTIEHDGHEYPMGIYRVKARPRGIFIESVESPQKDIEPIHPSIMNKNPCFGEFRSAATEMEADENWEGFFTLVHEFLQSTGIEIEDISQFKCCCYPGIEPLTIDG